MICGVPDHVDGRMLAISEARGREHHQPRPDVALHRGDPQLGPDLDAATASASCPGPSPLWLDATGKRLPVPLFPGFDTLGTLEHIMRRPATTTRGSC